MYRCCPTCRRPLAIIRIKPWRRLNNRESCDLAYQKAMAGEGPWNGFAILGLFFPLWSEAHGGIEYSRGSFAHQLRLADLLCHHAKDNARFCVEALFKSPDLAWVNSKTLDFLTDADKLTRWILPAVMKSQKSQATRAEWKPQEPTSAGVAFSPKRK